MKRLDITTQVSITLLGLAALIGCKSTGQPTDPYTCRIPPPPTYSYSSTMLGQQPNQQTVGYTPQPGATTYPGGAATCPAPGATCPNPATPAPVQGTGIVPITPSPTAGPTAYPPGASIDYNPTQYGSINGAATIYQTSATTTAPPPADSAWVAAQSVPTTASSETAARNLDTRAGSAPIVSGSGTVGVSATGFDSFAVSSSQVVTQVGDAPKTSAAAPAPAVANPW